RAGSGIVADLESISGIERPNFLEIFDREIVAGERKELVHEPRDRQRCREPGNAWVQWCPVLRNGGGVVAGEGLALRPLEASVAGCAIGLKDRRTARQTAEGPRLIQRPHGGKNPQGLCVECVAAALRDAVVVNCQVRRCRGSHRKTLPRGGNVTGKTAAALHATRVVVEVSVAAAYGTPVEQTLIRYVGELVERAVQRLRLARSRTENPGDAIGKAVRMAGPAAAPAVFRLLAFEIPRNDVADRYS